MSEYTGRMGYSYAGEGEFPAAHRHRFYGFVLVSTAVAFYIGLPKILLTNGYVQLFPDLLFLVLLFVLLADRNNGGRYRFGDERRLKKLTFAVYLFIALSLLELMNPNVPSLLAGLLGLRKTSFYLIALLIGVYLAWDYTRIVRFLRWVVILGIPICLYAYKQFYSPSAIDYKIIQMNQAGVAVYNVFGISRATSIFSSPFILGYFGNLIGAISIFLFAVSKKKRWLAAGAIGFFSVFCSVTRVNLVALVVVVLISFGLYFLSDKRRIFTVLVALSLALVGLDFLMESPDFQKYIQSVEPSGIVRDQRFLNRFAGYQSDVDLLAKNWFWGYGTGSAGDALDNYFTNKVHITSHNMFIKVYFELGLIGLLVFVYILWRWIRTNRFRKARAPTYELKALYDLALIALIILCVNGMTGGAIDSFPANMVTYLLMGLTARAVPLTKPARW